MYDKMVELRQNSYIKPISRCHAVSKSTSSLIIISNKNLYKHLLTNSIVFVYPKNNLNEYSEIRNENRALLSFQWGKCLNHSNYIFTLYALEQ